ncbi:MAG TPA: alpha/beta-hydrolase N-terminal domain-containing protein [Kineosporiaceae bacterium]|nr:alpha/beta-hydrolase N-terminal domain-containing protein [Kineosporiaceae bacterium]
MSTPVVRAPSAPGLVWAAGLFISSITPSLVPRTWYMQAVTSGICMAYGYAFGVGVGWLWRRISAALQLRITVSDRARRWLRRAGVAAVLVTMLAAWPG